MPKTKPCNIQLGRWLRKNRKRIGLTQTQFSQIIGISDDSVSRYERGQTAVPYDILYEMISFFKENGQ